MDLRLEYLGVANRSFHISRLDVGVIIDMAFKEVVEEVTCSNL